MESELCTGAICDLRVRRKTEELSFFAAASRFFPLLLRSLAKKKWNSNGVCCCCAVGLIIFLRVAVLSLFFFVACFSSRCDCYVNISWSSLGCCSLGAVFFILRNERTTRRKGRTFPGGINVISFVLLEFFFHSCFCFITSSCVNWNFLCFNGRRRQTRFSADGC